MKPAAHKTPGQRQRATVALEHFSRLAGLCLLTVLTGSLCSEPVSTEPTTAPHWSLQPLSKPSVPAVSQRRWPQTTIDHFILAKLEQRNLKPSSSADKRSLLRRVYFDLIGLPPTPEEMEAFLKDETQDAFGKVVDQLLASPRYGERWARHWMDAAHFAETHGHDQDRVRTNAWPYRDYLIRSLNEDKPYARFVQEQIAGDVLYPDDPQATVALGFIAAGPWDESSLRDIREDTVDRQIGRYLDRDDMITTVMATFTSTTVHCARCHDHKFDPISQQDYYALQAVFAGVDRADRVFDEDPKVHVRRQDLLRQRRGLRQKDSALQDSLLDSDVQAEVMAWERSLATNVVKWTVLYPASLASSNGTTLTRQADGAILTTGKRPEKDTYVVTARTSVRGLTAVRLELLTDDGLPKKGPGRQDNGNLHLSEFKVLVVTQAKPLLPSLDPSNAFAKEYPPDVFPNVAPIPLWNPTADFSQEGWGIAHAIDGAEKTAWGIYPKVGEPHQGVFEIKQPIDLDEAILAFVLEQQHGGGHLIGRFRLSVTTAAPPVRVSSVPDTIGAILSEPAEQRTAEQRRELAAFYLSEKTARQLAALPEPHRVYAVASDFAPDGGHVPAKAPRPVHVLTRGDIGRRGNLAAPGSLACVSGLQSRFDITNMNDEGARRAALAKWISDSRNPLTWRSIVNRVWHHHFGRGLVDTPNDFGRMGGRPSHPELLDWLANWFLEHGGSLKQLHRLIVLSSVYRQSSHMHPAALELDADNRLLWRMNRTRLEAECIRDAILQVSGQLDLKVGGPSFKNFALSPGIHVTPNVDYAQAAAGESENRRSVYRFLFRTLPDPFMDTLDCPAGDQLAPTRADSVTALQALAMLNNQFVVHQSEQFAARLCREVNDIEGQLKRAHQLVLNRQPAAEELEDLSAYARKHGLANACRLLFNSNEFMFVN